MSKYQIQVQKYERPKSCCTYKSVNLDGWKDEKAILRIAYTNQKACLDKSEHFSSFNLCQHRLNTVHNLIAKHI